MVAQRATSLRRGIEILIALGSEEALERDGLGVVRIAQRVGHEKSQVSRALSALAETGLVERDGETRAYRLGWRFFALASRSGRPRLMALAPRVLAGLVAELGETAHLSVLEGGEVLTLLSQAPPSAIRATGWSGRTVPSSCSSSGRALLFDHDRTALQAMFGGRELPRFGPRAPDDVDELERRISVARRRGYAVVDEEFEAGLVGVAAPVRDFTDRIVAAVNVSGPKFRLGRRSREAGAALIAAAGRLSRGMVGEPALPGAEGAGADPSSHPARARSTIAAGPPIGSTAGGPEANPWRLRE